MNMKIYNLLLILLSFFYFVDASAQNAQQQTEYTTEIFYKLNEKKAGNGNVVIYQDSRINKMVWKHVSQNKEYNGIQGFRIRIYSDLGQTAREKSQEANARFNELFPEISVYREYDSPYFKVYAGDYRTKNDALIDFKRIKQYIKNDFIVTSRINFPKLD